MSRFIIFDTPLSGVRVIQRKVMSDHRGFFSRLYCSSEFAELGVVSSISQINQSLTLKAGALRGLHFQMPPHAETKVVSCIKGRVFDVVVDIRRHSETFLKWHGEELSGENQKSLIVPEGFAHGFQALSDDCELIYLHTSPYSADAEGALNATDPRLAINWPLPVTEMSERDKSHRFIGPEFRGIEL